MPVGVSSIYTVYAECRLKVFQLRSQIVVELTFYFYSFCFLPFFGWPNRVLWICSPFMIILCAMSVFYAFLVFVIVFFIHLWWCKLNERSPVKGEKIDAFSIFHFINKFLRRSYIYSVHVYFHPFRMPPSSFTHR